MNLNKYLKKLLKEASGNLITIGIKDDAILEVALNNSKLENCNFLNSLTKQEQKRGRWSLHRDKSIGIKKFRKIFKKKKIDVIVCDILDMNKLFKSFIKDSVYICRGVIYYYGAKKDIDVTFLRSRYSRYNVIITEIELLDALIVRINVSKAKSSRIKDLWYFIKDSLISGTNILSDYLVN